MTRVLILLMLISALANCAVKRTPSPITQATDAQILTLSISTSASADTGKPGVFAPGSRWEVVGRISQGKVLRPQNGGLNVTGVHAHEGYAVFSNGALVGYWLPNERAFSPTSSVKMRFDQ